MHRLRWIMTAAVCVVSSVALWRSVSVAVTSTSVPLAPVLAVGDLSSCAPVSVSWSGASPATGFYSVQWVPVSTSGTYDFNSYSMFNVRGTSAELPRWFASRTDYAIRVFAMRADWDGQWHSTQNVTPHSNVVLFTAPTCTAAATATESATTTTVASSSSATTTTVASSSACPSGPSGVGGAYVVGDRGPGGGCVFYVASANFTSTGSDCNTTCRYLEAAPTDQSTGIVWATTALFCYATASDSGTSNCQANSIYSNTAGQSASRTASQAIGKGMANTNHVYARLTTAGSAATSTYAAGIAWAYTNNAKTDWHLPSKAELNELCKYARNQTTGNTATACDDTGSLRTGFASNEYWSSSEERYDLTYAYDFGAGESNPAKGGEYRVRPVRAFG